MFNTTLALPENNATVHCKKGNERKGTSSLRRLSSMCGRWLQARNKIPDSNPSPKIFSICSIISTHSYSKICFSYQAFSKPTAMCRQQTTEICIYCTAHFLGRSFSTSQQMYLFQLRFVYIIKGQYFSPCLLQFFLGGGEGGGRGGRSWGTGVMYHISS